MNVEQAGTLLLALLSASVAILSGLALRVQRRTLKPAAHQPLRLLDADIITAMGMRATLWAGIALALLIDPDLDFAAPGSVPLTVMARGTLFLFLAHKVGDLAFVVRRIQFWRGFHPGQLEDEPGVRGGSGGVGGSGGEGMLGLSWDGLWPP